MHNRRFFLDSVSLKMMMAAALIAIMAIASIPGFGAETDNQTSANPPMADVTADLAWARPAIVGGNGAAYLVLSNNGETPITLIGADTPIANVVEIHETVLLSDDELAAYEAEHGDDHHDHHDHHDDHGDHMDHGRAGGTFVMLHLSELQLDGGEQARFEPAGLHMMLIDLAETLTWDSTFPLTLYFLEAQPITVSVSVGDAPEEW